MRTAIETWKQHRDVYGATFFISNYSRLMNVNGGSITREVWVACKPLGKGYTISSHSRIRNPQGKLIRTYENKSTGYMGLYHRGKNYLVHRLVLEAFRGRSKQHTHHKDFNPRNNRLTNLERTSPRKNIYFSRLKGRMAGAKLTQDDATMIRKMSQSVSRPKLARMFRVGPHAISNVLNNRTWKASSVAV